MRRRAAGFISACVWAALAPSAAALTGKDGDAGPARIVSAALCADSYLFALADPAAVAAVSWQAGSPVSDAPAWALSRPRASADAERLIALGPDLVVFGPGEGGRAAALLGRADIAVHALQWGEDFETVRANYHALGAALGREAEAEALIADLDARLAALAARAEARGMQPSVFYLSVSGATAGTDTLIAAAIAAAGGRNAAAEAGARGWTQADAEWALRVTPDLVITSYFTRGYRGRSDLGQRHSAFRRLLADAPRVEIPGADWSCAGPGLIRAAEAIADALDGLSSPSQSNAAGLSQAYHPTLPVGGSRSGRSPQAGRGGWTQGLKCLPRRRRHAHPAPVGLSASRPSHREGSAFGRAGGVSSGSAP